jgi:hypothetical protein
MKKQIRIVALSDVSATVVGTDPTQVRTGQHDATGLTT